MQVSLGNVVLTWMKPVEISRQKYAFALTASFGFDDESLGFLVVKLLFEGLDITRQQPRFWEECEVFWEIILHGDQILGQEVLTSKCINAWKMISSLISFHLEQQLRHRWPIDEPDIPIFVLVDAGSEIHHLGNLMDQLILCIGDVDDELGIIAVDI